MMERRTFLRVAAAAPAALSATLSAPWVAQAQGRQKITYAYLLDPVYDAALWAIRKGIVKSDIVDVEATGANIPTLIQATATKQFDVVMTAVIGVPAAAARGLELRILSAALYASAVGEGGGVWVRRDSPLRDPAQLKGRMLASYGLRSTGYLFIREALAQRFGLNMALEGGDVRQVEVVAPNLPAALATSQTDAATLIHSQAFRARQAGDFVNICETGVILNEIHGRLVSAVNVAYPERLSARPDHYREFNRMIRESVRYALANRDEVFPDVARQANISREFFDWWFDRTTEVPGMFGEEHARAVTRAWEIGQRFAMIPRVPDVGQLTWEHTLRS
jgi:NitT/TauT family transport system substrate-binding protein